MGWLATGVPLDWEETKQYADYVRKHGVEQFINIYSKFKDGPCYPFKWGDEIEYLFVRLDNTERRASLLLIATDILPQLQKHNELRENFDWKPEYGAYMIEGSPEKPYGSTFESLLLVEDNMKRRREHIQSILDQSTGGLVVTLTSSPRLGCKNFSQPTLQVDPFGSSIGKSMFLPDHVINQDYPRYSIVTKNIRLRRGEKVAVNVPVYRDKYTPSPYEEVFPRDITGDAKIASKPGHIHMDASGFGVGLANMQVTFQASNMREALFLYDQLIPVCPILLALSASTPIYRGVMSDIDCRWYVLSASSDCRTKEERGEADLGVNQIRIPKSRLDSVSSYLLADNASFNDIELVVSSELYERLISANVEEGIARHIAHLFIHDPLILLRESIHQDDEKESGHFENIHSSVWQTLRLKPPSVDAQMGWRVEFRPLEVQITDFENAAFAVFVILLTRTILKFDLNLVMPISKVDENMRESERRDAVRRSKFYFRKDPYSTSTNADKFPKMDIGVIMNGGPVDGDSSFPGLIPLVRRYITTVEDADQETIATINRYLGLLSDRASGRLKTTAQWMRHFVDGHPSYQHDSMITDEICYDIVKTCADITRGDLKEAKGLLYI